MAQETPQRGAPGTGHLHLPDSGAAADGARRHAPSAARNLAPISQVLETVLPTTGRALEIASGTGQHVAAFATAFPGLHWQPSDVNPVNLSSIRAWVQDAPNVAEPIVLDASASGWAVRLDGWDAICLTNLLHLIPPGAAETVLREVAQALAPGGIFCLYGPFRRGGALVSDGDRAFDASLRAQDPAIGYKDIEWVMRTLGGAGLDLRDPVEMPASNLMVIARRPSAD